MTEDWMAAWEKTLELANGWMTGVAKTQEATLTAATRHLELMTHTYARLWGGDAPDVIPADRRFEGESWSENLAFDMLKQIYLIAGQWLVEMTDGLEGISPDLHKRAKFWTQQAVDAASPSNFAATNPEVLQEIVRTGGANLVQGFQNLISDLQQGRISMVPDGAFRVGKDLAITPGKVVYRNPLIELIQYTPTAKKVRETPILAIPPWINKYYVMDMRPENSMYKYLVDAGFTLFTISWKNPDESVRDVEWADYMEMGVIEALRVVQAITGSEKVSIVGYCLGGIVAQMTLAYLAAQGDEVASAQGVPAVNSATFFTTHQDYTDVGDLEVFLSEPEVRLLELLMDASGGYLDGRNMAATFNMLRANDLLWHYVVHNYLMGKEPPAFDLLYWNSDGTRVPGKVHSFLLRELFLANKLKEPDAIQIRGVGIDTRRVTIPSYAVACERDHIVPWRGASKIRQLMGGSVRFILAESGHIAGIINPPAKKRRGYWVNEAIETGDRDREVDPDTWLAGATRHEGSWWVDWTPWLKKQTGKLVEPPPMGSDEYPPIMDAPGTYVLER
jgi:polyhydroxyalkanoate synthase